MTPDLLRALTLPSRQEIIQAKFRLEAEHVLCGVNSVLSKSSLTPVSTWTQRSHREWEGRAVRNIAGSPSPSDRSESQGGVGAEAAAVLKSQILGRRLDFKGTPHLVAQLVEPSSGRICLLTREGYAPLRFSDYGVSLIFPNAENPNQIVYKPFVTRNTALGLLHSLVQNFNGGFKESPLGDLIFGELVSHFKLSAGWEESSLNVTSITPLQRELIPSPDGLGTTLRVPVLFGAECCANPLGTAAIDVLHHASGLLCVERSKSRSI